MNKKQTESWINHISKQIIRIQGLINIMSYLIQTEICFYLNIHLHLCMHVSVTCTSNVPTAFWFYSPKPDEAWSGLQDPHWQSYVPLYFSDWSILYISDYDSLQNKCSARTTIDLVLETSTLWTLLKAVWQSTIGQ